MTKKTKGAPARRPASAREVLRKLPRDAEDEAMRVVVEATTNLANAMEAQGVTRAELARRLELDRSTVTDLLHGSEGLSLGRLARAAHAIGLSLHVHVGPKAPGPVLVDSKTGAVVRTGVRR